MTLEFTEAALTALQLSTPLPLWMQGEVVFTINEKLGTKQIEELMFSDDTATKKAMVAWINEFNQKNEPYRVIPLGFEIAHPLFEKAVRLSEILSLMDMDPDIPSESAVVLGVAMVAKQLLES